MSKSEIYNYLTSESTLSDKHKKELIESRGFSEETITKTRLRSCGQDMIRICEAMFTRFDQKDLVDARVFIEQNGNVRMNPILIEERILIPYIDQAGDVYHIRPHKMGLEGIPIEVYQDANLVNAPKEIILTEGEFKAMAGIQYGIPTIAIPGISSFAEQHFARLVDLLNKNKVREVVIIFDNEVKNDPAFPKRYKDEPIKRYDTQFYAIYMAKRLEKENIKTRIGHLPDGWRYQGKIDIDGALAQKKTKGELLSVMENAKTHYAYLGDLEPEAQRVIKIKIARKYFTSHVSKAFGHYEAIRKNKVTEVESTVPISNFILRVVATYRTPEGVIRDVQMQNEVGEFSGTFSIRGEDMQAPESFNTFCNNKGNFQWWGTKHDLQALWREEFLNDDGRHIYEPDHVGWIESEKLWLFQNVAIGEDGKEYHPDKNGIFWVNQKGIKPIALTMGGSRNGIAEGVPALYLHEFDIKEFMVRLSDVIGKEQMLLCMGLVSAMPFMEEIFETQNGFPFLFFDGKRGSGKTSIAEWVASIAGMLSSGRMASDTTSVAVQRYLAYHSCLPFLIDEMRNEKKVNDKIGLFRNIYNRQGAGKGIKANFGIREARIRGTMIFAGEDIPTDNAFRSRCIEIFVSEHQREGKPNHYNWMTANQEKFSRHFYDILKNKAKLKERFLKELQENVDYMRGRKDLNPRVALNYAIVLTSLYVVHDIKDQAFGEWLLRQARAAKQESDKTHAMSEFLDGVLYLKQIKEIDEKFYSYDVQKNKIYLWFEGCINKYMEHFTRINKDWTFSKEAIRKYLKDDPSFIASGKNHRFEAQVEGSYEIQYKAMVFRADKAPDPLKALVDIPVDDDDTGNPGTGSGLFGTGKSGNPSQAQMVEK